MTKTTHDQNPSSKTDKNPITTHDHTDLAAVATTSPQKPRCNNHADLMGLSPCQSKRESERKEVPMGFGFEEANRACQKWFSKDDEEEADGVGMAWQ